MSTGYSTMFLQVIVAWSCLILPSCCANQADGWWWLQKYFCISMTCLVTAVGVTSCPSRLSQWALHQYTRRPESSSRRRSCIFNIFLELSDTMFLTKHPRKDLALSIVSLHRASQILSSFTGWSCLPGVNERGLFVDMETCSSDRIIVTVYSTHLLSRCIFYPVHQAGPSLVAAGLMLQSQANDQREPCALEVCILVIGQSPSQHAQWMMHQGQMQGEAWGACGPHPPLDSGYMKKMIDYIPLQLLNCYSRWTVDQQLELSSFKQFPRVPSGMHKKIIIRYYNRASGMTN